MNKFPEREGPGTSERFEPLSSESGAASIHPAEAERQALEQQVALLHYERRQLHQELFEAAQVQRKLSGPRQLRRGALELATESFAVRFLSGDFATLWEHERSVTFALGDIAGKGLAAGMWFTHIVSLLRVYAESRPQPAEVLAEINRDLCRMRPGPPLTTLFLGKLDWCGTLSYCNAGHPAPQLLRHGGGTASLREGGPLLGALADASFNSGQVTLCPGDSLIAYTDGLVECRNSGDEEFGIARLLGAARSAEGISASSLLFSILGAAQDFSAGQPRHDDLSLLVIRHLEGVAH